MVTTTTSVRMSQDTKKRLKLLAVELGETQSNLIDKYVQKGLKEDELKLKKKYASKYNLDEIREILKEDVAEDKQKGISSNQGSLSDLVGIIDLGYETDSVMLKKED